MEHLSTIEDVARFLYAAGYQSRYDRDHLPPYQEGIRTALQTRSAASSLVDSLGFVSDKEARRVYLRQRLDLEWFKSSVVLTPPLGINMEAEVIYGEYAEIRGGSEDPPLQGEARGPWWKLWK
jgi:hypothetical protein